MKSPARYSLILSGIVAFLALSPLIVMFVSGTKYDFRSKRFVETGTLNILTDPRGAKVLIDGESYGKTNRTIRFVSPGDYSVELKKDGYFTWSKKLNVKAHYVTNVNAEPKGIALFYSDPKIVPIANNLLDAYVGRQRLVYATKDKIFAADAGSPDRTQELGLPAEMNALQITAAKSENYFLVSGYQFEAVFDVRNNRLIDISKLTGPAELGALQFSDDDLLYQLLDNELYRINWNDNNKELLLQNVLAFHANSDAIYYIKSEVTALGQQTSLVRAQFPSLQEKILVPQLPALHTASLLLSANNQLFILGDNNLYTGDETPLQIASGVETAAIDDSAKQLLYSTGNEVDLYDLISGNSELVTRSSQTITNPVSALDLGWVFFINDGRLQNIEIDNREHQNNFTFANINPGAKFFLDQNAENIFLLENGNLTEMKIR